VDKLRTLFRRAKIVTRIASFVKALIMFAKRFSEAKKEEDPETKKKLFLDAFSSLAKEIPYDLPGLLSLEFKNDTGGN